MAFHACAAENVACPFFGALRMLRTGSSAGANRIYF
jgi:hypothetical protein